MPSVLAISTASPQFHYTIEEVLSVGRMWLGHDPEKLARFERFARSSKVESRYFCIPPEHFFELGGLEKRSAAFEETGTTLGSQAIAQALNQVNLSASDISTLIFSSCSIPSIPSIDGLMIENCGISRTCTRIPIFQHGCAGGVVGLELASKLSSSQGLVAVTSVELCSLVFQPKNPSPAQLVGSAIFADGAACAIISSEEKGLVIRGSESYLLPNSKHLMGYELFDDGFHLRLDRELPQKLAGSIPERVDQFLGMHNLKPDQVKHWLFHPGGIKILDYLEQGFSLRPEQSIWARDILKNFGNMSSATVLYVLKAFIESKAAKPGDKALMLGVGPGLTVELILFEQLG